MRNSRLSSAPVAPEPSADPASERRIAIHARTEPELERALIAFARSEQPPARTRERVLEAVLAKVSRKVGRR